MKIRKVLALILALILVLSCFAGCGAAEAPAEEPKAPEAPVADAPVADEKAEEPVEDYGTIPANISIGSSPAGQAAYTMCAGIADVVNKAGLGTTVTAEETGGFPVNVQLMMNGDIEFGFINNFMMQQVYSATGAYSQYEAEQVYSVLTLGPAEMHIIVPVDSDIESIYDFHGKRIGVGQPGGVVLDVTTMFLDAIGYKEDDFERLDINLANQCEYMQDGQLDAIMWIGNYPLAAVTSLTTTKDVRFLDIDDEAVAKMQEKCSVIEKCIIPAGTYKGVDKDINSFCMRNMLVAHKDVSNEAVYQMTKAIMENVEVLGAVHAAMGKISKDTVTLGMTADTPLHPGALRYYREIGVEGVDALAAE